VDSPTLRNFVRSKIGIDVVQVSNAENSIIHRRERELEADNSSRNFTDEEENKFFERLDFEIALAHQGRSKSLRSLQRDKAIFHTQRVLGLREGEVLALGVRSFQNNPDFPEFFQFGIARVYSKKTKKWRNVAVDDPTLPAILKWYIGKVRPQFLAKAAEGEDALFLSERGTRLTYAGYYSRFILAAQRSNMPRELHPHCLRHSSVTHDNMEGVSYTAIQIKHGHSNPSTTQVYTHIPDAFVKAEHKRITDARMRRAMKKPTNDDKT
jgi:site-specific recombinase XerD